MKQLLGDVKEVAEYWKLQEKVLECTVCRTDCGGGYGHETTQTTG
jgi:hypothetical protein